MKQQTITVNVSYSTVVKVSVESKNVVIGQSPYPLMISFDSLNFVPVSPGQMLTGGIKNFWIYSLSGVVAPYPVTFYFYDFDLGYQPSIFGPGGQPVIPVNINIATRDYYSIAGTGTQALTFGALQVGSTSYYNILSKVKICNVGDGAAISANLPLLILSSGSPIARILPGASETFDTCGSSSGGSFSGGELWTLSNPNAAAINVGVIKTYNGAKMPLGYIINP